MMKRTFRRIYAWRGDSLFRVLIKNSGWLLSGSGAATAIGVVGLALKTHSLGPEAFGLLTVILAYVAIVQRISTFQPAIALIKFGSEALAAGRRRDFMGAVKTALLLDLMGGVLGTGIAVGFAHMFATWKGWDASIPPMIAMAGASLLFNVNGTAIGILRVLNRFKGFTVQQVTAALVGLTGSAVVYAANGGLWWFLFVSTLSAVVGNVMLAVQAWLALQGAGLLRYRGARARYWRPFVRFSGWTYVSSTLDLPVKQFDVIIVSMVLSLEAVGVYKIIKQVGDLLGLLADPVYQAVYPQFATMTAKRNGRSAAKYAVKIGIVMTMVLAPVSLLLAGTSQWWLEAAFGEGFSAGWLPLACFLLVRTVSVAGIGVHPLFTAMGYVRENVGIVLAANAVYLGAAWLLARQLGLVGIAFALLLHILVITGWRGVYVLQGARIRPR